MTDNRKKYYMTREITDLKDMLRQSVALYGKNPAFLQKIKKGGDYKEINYLKFLNDINSLGTRLLDMGLKDQKIAIIGPNCYHFVLAYYAIVCGVGVAVPLDKELSSAEINNLIKQADCKAIFYTEDFIDDIDFSLVDHKFEMKQYPSGICAIDRLIKEGKKLINMNDTTYVTAKIDPEKMHMLLFTSGTTGNAKGVMLNHRNIVSNIMDICKIVKVYPEDRSLSLLPIHHTFESTIGIATLLYAGGSVAFYEGLKYVAKNFREAKATVLIAVPLIVESMYNKILKEAAKTKRTKILNFGISLNKTLSAMGLDLKKQIFKSVYKQFGGKLRLVVSGAAAVDPKVVRGFEDLGIRMIQGYGLTECSPLISGTPDFDNTYRKAGSVGPVVESGQIKIIDKDDDGIGEVIYKGPNVMMGYYKNKEETAKVLKDGWFYTGDLAFTDDKGWIYITGRKKNVIVTKTGKNIYPEEIEMYFLNSKYICEILVYGATDEDTPDSDTIVAAQIRPDMDMIHDEFGEDFGDEALYDLIKKTVGAMNMELPNYKRIRNMMVRKEEFEKTTTKKIKRHRNV